MNNTISPRKTEGLAIASLILSVIAFFAGPFGFVPGIICGHIARARIRKDSSLGGDGLAMAGLIVGYIALAYCAVIVVLFFGVVAHNAYVEPPTFMPHR